MDSDAKRQARKIAALLELYRRAARREIQSTRKDKGVNQEEVAERMAMTLDIVSNIEIGRREITLPEFIVLAKQIGADPVVMLKRILVT